MTIVDVLRAVGASPAELDGLIAGHRGLARRNWQAAHTPGLHPLIRRVLLANHHDCMAEVDQLLDLRTELAGHGQPCHADLLLANTNPSPGGRTA